jgi:hypothetical protein
MDILKKKNYLGDLDVDGMIIIVVVAVVFKD